MGTLQMGELAAVGTALLWTLSTLAWTSAGKSIGVLAVSFIRLVITCVFLGLYGFAARGLWLPSDADAQTWLVLGISGFAGFFICDLLLFKSFMVIGPRLSLLVFSLTPPLAAVMSWLWLDDVLLPRHWLGMAVTLGGVAWVVMEESDEDAADATGAAGVTGATVSGATGSASAVPLAAANGGGLGLGVTLAILASFAAAIGTVLSKKGLGDYDAVPATFIRVLGGMVGYLVLTTLIGYWPAMFRATRDARAMLTVTFGALVGPFMGVVLYLVALRNCPAGIVATIVSTMPVLILPFSITLHNEKVSLRAACGAAVSVAGVGLLVS